MKYDVASKVVIDIGKEAILQRFFGLDTSSIHLIEELPEETVSLKRTDFPLLVILKDGQELIVLLEIQTYFDRDFVIRLIDYTARFMLKYHQKIIPSVLLLTPSPGATGFYEDDIFAFKYRVIRLWEEQSSNFMDDIRLYPFLPLMEGGRDILEEADTRIYNNTNISIETKADLLTAMAIFAGLKDRELTTWLIERRRDIMIQSVAYEIIKEEGIREGKIEGIREGKIEGIREGKIEGIIEGFQQSLLETLETKFDAIPMRLVKAIKDITDIETLRILQHQAIKCNSVEEFSQKLKLIIK